MTNMPSLIPVDFDPFEDGKEIEKIIFTNDSQREIWLSCMIGGEEANLAYNESVSLDFDGALNFDAFKKAIGHLVLRHESLRSTVSPNGENLIIYKDYPTAFKLDDISLLDKNEIREKLDTFLRTQLDTPLDLQNGPLFKVFMHKLSADRFYFTLIKHHLIGDGWSTGIMLEDLSKMYNAYSKDEDISLGRSSQISDYAIAQERFKLTEAYNKTEDYWLNLYSDQVPVVNLPTDRPRQSPRSYKGYRIDYPLSGKLVNQLKTTGAKVGASLVTTLLAGFEILLYSRTQQREIVVGLPASGQSASGMYDVVGHCVNLLPLKTQIDPSLSFSDYLKKRKVQILDAYDHQRLTFGELIKKLYIPRDNTRIPLVPVIFNIDMGMDQAVSFEQLEYKLFSNPRSYENFEIYLNASGSKNGILLEWSYNTGLFDKNTIDSFHHEYYSILKKIVENPDIDIAALSGINHLKTEIIKPNVHSKFEENQTLNDLIEDAAKMYPKKTAVSFDNKILSYEELQQKVNQLASYLVDKGVKPGDIVGLCSDRSIEMLVFLLGILKAGAVYIPLDPSYPHERIEFMMQDSSAKFLITNSAYKQKYNTEAQKLIIEEIFPLLKALEKFSHNIKIAKNSLAYILYTSGSTGKPKGVKISHRNLINFLVSMRDEPGMTSNDCLLAITTMSFDIAGLELYLPLITGAELVIATHEATRDGRLLLNALREKKITVMQATPSTWQMMIDSGLERGDLSKILCGGEALSKELAEKLLLRCDELWNMYGPTETTIWSTIKHVKQGETTLTIGFPIVNTQIYIVDESNKQVPIGESGEILIGGDGVAEGYLNRPELTREKFMENIYSNDKSSCVYRTGDLGIRLNNGEVQCLGRIDQQVKIRGHRIELEEIESVLSEQDHVKQAVVVAREDIPSDKRLIAYVVVDNVISDGSILSWKEHQDTIYNTKAPNHKFIDSSGDPSSSDQIYVPKTIIESWTNNLKQQLPDYMVPVDYIIIKSFPLTPNNKIDKKALPKPQVTSRSSVNTTLQELNKNERIVLNIWRTVLDLDYIGVNDDFFELGGHSLLAVKVMTSIEKETGKRLPLAVLFDNSTIAKLAKKINLNEEEKLGALVPIKPTGNKAPLYLIHGAGLNILLFKFISGYLDEEQPVYGLQAAGLSKPSPLLYTIEEISALYINEMLESNPNGPYCLTGYSSGGFIAFEMARQLIELGKEVKFVGIVDCYACNQDISTSTGSVLLKKIRRQFRKFPFVIKSFIKYPYETFSYQLNYVKYKLNLFKPTGFDELNEQIPPHEKEIYKSYNIAHRNYNLSATDIKVNLFSVDKRLYYIDDPIYLGWKQFAKKGVEIANIPGDHITMLAHPNDKEFAAILQKSLNNT